MKWAKRKPFGSFVVSGFVLLCAASSCISTGLERQVPDSGESHIESMRSIEVELDVPSIESFDHKSSLQPRQFVGFGQCQFDIAHESHPSTDLPIAADPIKLINDIRECLRIAAAEAIDVLVLAELALAIPEDLRRQMIGELQQAAEHEDMIIIGGSFYDENHYARVPIIGPGWIELGYKLKPSRAEVSPVAGKGMKPGKAIPVIHTDYGSFIILTCVDLLSDEAQYAARKLATSGHVHAIVNNCCNPAAWEFLVEANSIARRHAVFVMVTNVMDPEAKEDTGYSFGHTSLFGNLRNKGNAPNSQRDLLALLPDPLVHRAADGRPVTRKLPYDSVIADLGFNRRAMLVYDLNLYLRRIPMKTNAPDQGYPPIRNFRIIDID